MIYFSKNMIVVNIIFLSVSGMFLWSFFVIVIELQVQMNSFELFNMMWNVKLSCKLTDVEKCLTAADMKFAVDKVVVHAHCHVHGFGNIASIIW
jgi:hypothetical protein